MENPKNTASVESLFAQPTNLSNIPDNLFDYVETTKMMFLSSMNASQAMFCSKHKLISEVSCEIAKSLNVSPQFALIPPELFEEFQILK